MALNSLGREIPDTFAGKKLTPYRDPWSLQPHAERSTRAIYIHSHMDEENFDVARVMKCCVGVPETDGSNTPTCSYNVLYRERDARFADRAMLDRMAQTRPLPIVGRVS